MLHKIAIGKLSDDTTGLTPPNVDEDFDPNILDNFEKPSPPSSPLRSQQHHQSLTLCAKTVLAHLVKHLGHFPLAIGAAHLSSLVVEHDDVPNLSSDELSATIFTVPNIQVTILIIQVSCYEYFITFFIL